MMDWSASIARSKENALLPQCDCQEEIDALRTIAAQLAEVLRENGSHVRKCEWCMGARHRALEAWEIYNERK